MMNLIKLLRKDERGSYLVEFAIVLPVFMTIVMGLLDFSYQLYSRAVFEGVVQKAARDATLEDSASVASSTLIDTKVKNAFKDMNSTVNDSNFTFSRRNFKDFSNAGKMEPSTGPGGRCASPVGGVVYTYSDVNNSNSWDDGAIDGQGGANDVVLYTATVSYRSLFPINSLFGASPYQTIKASTVLRNQPYNDQPTRAIGPTRNCT